MNRKAQVILISGKGGTGKTTLACLLLRILKEKKRGSILAVDADANSNLAEFLGIEKSFTVSDIVDEIKENPQSVPGGFSKDSFIEYRIQSSISEAEGFDLLTMGRPEGPGCYCYVNNVLKNILSKLIKEYDFIIIDSAAGLEHLSRRIISRADFLIIVSDATPAGIRAALRIHNLRKELKIDVKEEFLIVNRSDNKDFKPNNIEDLGYLGNIPEDPQITNLSLNNGALLELKEDSLGLRSLRQIEEKLWPKNS